MLSKHFTTSHQSDIDSKKARKHIYLDSTGPAKTPPSVTMGEERIDIGRHLAVSSEESLGLIQNDIILFS